MKQTVNSTMFHDAFERMNRKENFSYEALELLFDYLDECDENMELDVIEICCDFTEDTLEGVINNYSIDVSDCDTEDEKEERVQQYLEHHTILVGVTTDTYVYANF